MEWTAWLVETGSISVEQLENAARLANLRSMPLPDALLTLGYTEPLAITRAFSAQFGFPLIDFYGTRIPEEVIRAVPDLVALDLEVCPVAVIGTVLWYATPHITDPGHRDRLCGILNRDARPIWAPREWVLQVEREYYAVCHVTASGSGWWFARYGDADWGLVAGNRYCEYHTQAARGTSPDVDNAE